MNFTRQCTVCIYCKKFCIIYLSLRFKCFLQKKRKFWLILLLLINPCSLLKLVFWKQERRIDFVGPGERWRHATRPVYYNKSGNGKAGIKSPDRLFRAVKSHMIRALDGHCKWSGLLVVIVAWSDCTLQETFCDSYEVAVWLAQTVNPLKTKRICFI
jgi:hypothetical protein